MTRALRIRDAVRVVNFEFTPGCAWPPCCMEGDEAMLAVGKLGTVLRVGPVREFLHGNLAAEEMPDVVIAAVAMDVRVNAQLSGMTRNSGKPYVLTWLIPVDALERVDEDDELRTTIALDVLARVKQLEAEQRDTTTQRALRSRVVKVLRTIAADIISGRKVARGA